MAKLKEEQKQEVSESYISVGLGLLVVVVVGILLYNYFTQRGKQQPVTQDQDKLAQEATMAAKPGSTYTVVAGDTLWSISEKSYGTGYNYGAIAEANNLQNTDQLEAGQQLLIPEVSPPAQVIAEVSASPIASLTPQIVVDVTPAPAPATDAVTITGTAYTVVKGDTLWSIACRAYGDCYAWSRIAQTNKLDNPDLIHPGNNLTLPR